MFLLTSVEYIARKLPPIFVKPWTHPIPTSIIFLKSKNFFLNEENLLLFKISKEEKIKSIATSNLKSKKYLNFKAIIKNIIKNGRQYKLYSFINFVSLIFDLKNCNELIVIDTGIKIFIVLAKSYPNSKNEGVPNNNKPTPNIDWIAININMSSISNIGLIKLNAYNT